VKFTVEIPDDTVGWAQAEAANRQVIAKFMREELEKVGRLYGHVPELGKTQRPGESHEWRAFIFNSVKVTAEPRVKKKPAKAKVVDARKYVR
jgi:hypothetical protein